MSLRRVPPTSQLPILQVWEAGVSSKFEFVIDTAAGTTGAFTVGSSTATLDVQPGQNTQLPVTFTGAASGSTITATCVNLPVGASCSYSNGVVTISTSASTPAGSYNVTVIFTAAQQTSAMARRDNTYLATAFGLTGLPLGLLWIGGGRKKSLRRCFRPSVWAFADTGVGRMWRRRKSAEDIHDDNNAVIHGHNVDH